MRTPKIQSVRKLGNLIRVGYGTTLGNVAYGYGPTRKLASEKAREEWKNHITIAPEHETEATT